MGKKLTKAERLKFVREHWEDCYPEVHRYGFIINLYEINSNQSNKLLQKQTEPQKDTPSFFCDFAKGLLKAKTDKKARQLKLKCLEEMLAFPDISDTYSLRLVNRYVVKLGGKEAVELLKNVALDYKPSWNRSTEAVDYIGNIKGDFSLKAMKEIFNKKNDTRVWARCIYGIMDYKDDEFYTKIIGKFNNKCTHLQRAILVYARELKDKGCLKLLKRGLEKDRHIFVREKAMYLMDGLKGEEAKEVYRFAMDDESQSIRNTAKEALLTQTEKNERIEKKRQERERMRYAPHRFPPFFDNRPREKTPDFRGNDEWIVDYNNVVGAYVHGKYLKINLKTGEMEIEFKSSDLAKKELQKINQQ